LVAGLDLQCRMRDTEPLTQFMRGRRQEIVWPDSPSGMTRCAVSATSLVLMRPDMHVMRTRDAGQFFETGFDFRKLDVPRYRGQRERDRVAQQAPMCSRE
jgi:hypothetical protein